MLYKSLSMIFFYFSFQSDKQQRKKLHWTIKNFPAYELHFTTNFGYSIVIKGIQQHTTNFCERYLSPNKNLFQSYVWSNEDFKETHSTTPSQCINNLFMKTVAEISNSRSIKDNFLENLSKKESYALSSTALDCSIMLTFQCISDTDTNRYVQQRNMLLPGWYVMYDLCDYGIVFFIYLKTSRCCSYSVLSSGYFEEKNV